MNKKVHLHFKNFIIRPLTADDLVYRVQWYNDPAIRETLILDQPLELDKTMEWFKTIEHLFTRLDLVIENADEKPIGMTGLREIDLQNKSAGIYMVLGDKAFWGQGIMYDVHLCLLNYVFRNMNLTTIWANILSNNIASYVTLKKVGFSRLAVLRNEFFRDAVYYDIYRVAVSSSDFYRKHPELK